MFDVFFNDFLAQHGVLAVDMGQSTHLAYGSGIENMFFSNDVAISNLFQVAGNEFNFKCILQDAKLMVSPHDAPPRPPRLHSVGDASSNNTMHAVSVMVSPDDQPPRPPRAYLIGNCSNLETDLPALASIMADPDGDPPIPSKLLQLTGNLFNFNSTLHAPKVMVSPDDEPPRPPR